MDVSFILLTIPVFLLAWAGADRKMLYITGSEGIFRVHLKIAGEPVEKK